MTDPTPLPRVTALLAATAAERHSTHARSGLPNREWRPLVAASQVTAIGGLLLSMVQLVIARPVRHPVSHVACPGHDGSATAMGPDNPQNIAWHWLALLSA